MKIRRIGGWSLGKTFGVIYGGIGVLVGLAAAVSSAVWPRALHLPIAQGETATLPAVVAAIVAIIIVPEVPPSSVDVHRMFRLGTDSCRNWA
jgi:hypothetical protein